MNNILIIGGAGYIGTVLTKILISNEYNVTIIDNLTHRVNTPFIFLDSKNFNFVQIDVIRDFNANYFENFDYVINLAAIVGAPACNSNPSMAIELNQKFVEFLSKVPNIKLIQASTCSNYGARVGGNCNEYTPLNSLSVYGDTKIAAEKIIFDNCNSISLRVATGYGISPRFRADLIVHEFIYKAMKEKSVLIYESHYQRAFIHVVDIAFAYLHAIKKFDILKGKSWNVVTENFSKKELIEKIQKFINFNAIFAEVGKDPDQRNYAVDGTRFFSTGFFGTKLVEDSIPEIINTFKIIIKEKSIYTNV